MNILRSLRYAALTAGAAALPLCAPALAQADRTQAPVLADTASATPVWQASDDDFLLLQLVVKNYKLTLDVRGYQTDQGVCLDLADVIQSLDLPIRLDKKSRRATGWLFAEDQRFTLDREANTVQNMNMGRAPVSDDIYDTPEGWCVDTKALSRWFGIEFRPDLYNALVRLESERDLPFMQAIERRSRAARLKSKRQTFDLSKYPSQDMEYRAWRTPSLDVVAETGVRNGGPGSQGLQGQIELFAAGEALGASYFARLATNDQLEPQTVRVRAYRNDPEGKLLGPLGATQIAAGDVETIAGRLTGQTAVGRGAFISNRPLGQPTRFSATTLRGTLPAGWDAELYRNGQLIAFQEDRGDGRYEFVEIELFFGRNDLEIVLYGPQGQVRREKTSVPVGFNQIEPGKTYYWAGILQNQRDLVQLDNSAAIVPQKWRWGVGVERGLDARTSAALGVQNLYFAGARRTFAEGALTRSFGSVQMELIAAHELGAGSATEANVLGRLGKFNFGFNALASFGSFTSEFAPNDIDFRAGFNFDTSLALGKIALPIQADISHAQLKDGSYRNEFIATTSVTAGRLALSAQIDHLDQGSGPNTPPLNETRLRLLANARFKRVRLRGNASFNLAGNNPGLDNAIVRLDANIGRLSQMQGQLEYRAQGDEFRFTAGYTRQFDKLSLRGSAIITSLGEVGASVQLAFSLGPDPVSGGVRVSQTKLARSGQAAVTVFRDEDGNGRRDPGEEPLTDVLVEAGLRSTDAITGENGRAIVDDLRPFRPVLVGVDEASLGDPFLAPAVKGIVITPRPGVVTQIELPIAPTGEVEGMLVSPSGTEQPGAALELVNQHGEVTASTLTEFDGFFLFERVPYGTYRLQVAEDTARALDVERSFASDKANADFLLDRTKDVIRLGPVKLNTKGSGQDSPSPDDPSDRLQTVAIRSSSQTARSDRFIGPPDEMASPQ